MSGYDPVYPSGYTAAPVITQESPTESSASTSTSVAGASAYYGGYSAYIPPSTYGAPSMSMYAPEAPDVTTGYSGYVASEPAMGPARVPVYGAPIPLPIVDMPKTPSPSGTGPSEEHVDIKPVILRGPPLEYTAAGKPSAPVVVSAPPPPRQAATTEKIKSLPLPKISNAPPKAPPSKKQKFNEYLGEVARINEEIERLQSLQQKYKDEAKAIARATGDAQLMKIKQEMIDHEESPVVLPSEQPREPPRSSPNDDGEDDCMIVKEVTKRKPKSGAVLEYVPQTTSTSCSSSGYDPTPLADLKRMKEKARAQHVPVDAKSILNPKKHDGRRSSRDESGDDHPTSSGSGGKLKKYAKRRLSEEEISNLFDGEEDEEIPRKKKKKKALPEPEEDIYDSYDPQSPGLVSSAPPKKVGPTAALKQIQASKENQDVVPPQPKSASSNKTSSTAAAVSGTKKAVVGPPPPIPAKKKSSAASVTSNSSTASNAAAAITSSRKSSSVEGAPSSSKPSAAAAAMATKPKALTSDQIAAAKQRIARPAASNVRPINKDASNPQQRQKLTAAQQLQKRMETISAEAMKKKDESSNTARDAKKKPVTQEQLYGEHRSRSKAAVIKSEPRVPLPPKPSRAEKPQLIDPSHPKVPMTVRIPYLNKIHAQYLEFLSPSEAKEMAETEERAIVDKILNRQGYMVACVNLMKRIRDAAGTPTEVTNRAVSHQQVLAGRHAGDISIGIRRNSKVAETTEQDFYAYLLSKHLADTEALRLNSYPLWTDFDKDEVAIASVQRDVGKGKKHWTPDHDLVRDCSRCGTEFFINPRGPPTKVDCCYHPQRTVYVRAKFEQRFQCCNQESTARGCSMASYHVSDTLRNSELKTFVEAPDASGPDDPRSKKVYALDCEMVYTVHGPAVARLSVVDVTNEMVLDVLIKPEHQVTDFNTRFSGITANMLEEGDIYSRAEAQQMLFDFVNKETILVGHSLESDLKAMRIVHMNVVDTALVYPHKNGPPAKRALRNIAYDELGMIIQADEGGHDSKEDAAACMKLLRHKAGYDKVHLARM